MTVSSTRRSTRASAGRDLVHRAVQVVDPSLERDGEVDEVGLAAAEQDELRGPDAPELTETPAARTSAMPAATAAPIAIHAATEALTFMRRV